MAECAGLENQCTFTGTEGSNPSLSALEDQALHLSQSVGLSSYHEYLGDVNRTSSERKNAELKSFVDSGP